MSASELKLSLVLVTLSGEPWSYKAGAKTRLGSLMACNANNDPIVGDLLFRIFICQRKHML